MTRLAITLAALALASSTGCSGDALPGILGIDPAFKPDYTVVETKRQDYAGKPRVSSTITLPKGLDKARLEANVRHAIYTAHKGSVVTPGGIRVGAYQEQVEERPYTAALGVFSPDGKWTTADPTASPATWQLSLAVRDWYLRGEDPPPLQDTADAPPVAAPPSSAMQGLLTGITPAMPVPRDAGVLPPDAGATDLAGAPPDVETAELKVFSLDHKGQPTSGTLRIDDEVVGETPWTGQIAVGNRKVSVNWRFTLATIVGGQSNTVTIKLGKAKQKQLKKEIAPVGGTLAKAKILTGINADLSGLRSCYEKELKKDQFLRGKVVVGFVIDQDGQVAKASIQSSEIDNKRVSRCIVSRVRRLKFAKPDGGSVEVAYPLSFKPKA